MHAFIDDNIDLLEKYEDKMIEKHNHHHHHGDQHHHKHDHAPKNTNQSIAALSNAYCIKKLLLKRRLLDHIEKRLNKIFVKKRHTKVDGINDFLQKNKERYEVRNKYVNNELELNLKRFD